MSTPQAAIFREHTAHHWFGHFALIEGVEADTLKASLRAVRSIVADGVSVLVTLSRAGLALLAPTALPDGLADYRGFVSPGGHEALATQTDVFVWVHSDGPDRNIDAIRAVVGAMSPAAPLSRETTGWVYQDSRDLTGFIDGTANPNVDDARLLAVVQQGRLGVGGSFVLAQRWVHDLDGFSALDLADQEAAVGRTKAESIEFEVQPPNSHVARVVLTDDDGDEIEIYRRSVPYGNGTEAGLYFLAFSASLEPFEAMMERMYGAVDGITDRLIDFSRAVSGAYYFAPSVEDLDAWLA
jgi:putative iron-dependent peroxidase